MDMILEAAFNHLRSLSKNLLLNCGCFLWYQEMKHTIIFCSLRESTRSIVMKIKVCHFRNFKPHLLLPISEKVKAETMPISLHCELKNLKSPPARPINFSCSPRSSHCFVIILLPQAITPNTKTISTAATRRDIYTKSDVDKRCIISKKRAVWNLKIEI